MNTLTHSQYIADALISSALCLGKLLGPEQVVRDKIHTFGKYKIVWSTSGCLSLVCIIPPNSV